MINFFQISDALSPIRTAASVFVPSRGWVVFGGYGSTLLTAQKLGALNGTWQAGPNMYQDVNEFSMCGVQVYQNLSYRLQYVFSFKI